MNEIMNTFKKKYVFYFNFKTIFVAQLWKVIIKAQSEGKPSGERMVFTRLKKIWSIFNFFEKMTTGFKN